ncbi:unnamed protein product [Tenebrio molitor]|nr:unnamed protein product [Tenebrio molitor]
MNNSVRTKSDNDNNYMILTILDKQDNKINLHIFLS